MIKPRKLRRGDRVAVVSLSSGLAGEDAFRQRFDTGCQRLREVFGLEPVVMPNALKGIDYLHRRPEARAQDLIQAFRDPEIRGIVSAIGGEDTVRLLPYVDYGVIRDNPKVFLGYSDTTANHFMLYRAGVVSFYGACVMAELAENVEMHDYTVRGIRETLFEAGDRLEIRPSPCWTSQLLEWADPANVHRRREMTADDKGFELLQGAGRAEGRLLGGCTSVLQMLVGTEIWPAPGAWDDVILFLETAEDYPPPVFLGYLLRNFLAQGILNRIRGIIVGKPVDERYYQEYKEVYRTVVGVEAGRPDLPILYNVNFGHTAPGCVLPYGVRAEIDCDSGTFSLLESAVVGDA